MSVLFAISYLLAWLHANVLAPLVRFWEERILGTSEAVVTALMRESFAETTRFASGLSAWFVSLFHHNYQDSLRRSWHQNRGHAPSQPSTLNAIIEAMSRKDCDVAAIGKESNTCELFVMGARRLHAWIDGWYR